MFKPVLNSVLYIIRASGLVMLGIVSSCYIVIPMFPMFFNGGEEAENYRGISIQSILGVWLLAAVGLSWPRIPDAWRKDPPTQKQLAFAASLEIDVPEGISKGELSNLISQVTGR